MRFSKLFAAMILVPTSVGLVTLPGCSTAPPTAVDTQNLNTTAMASLATMENSNPTLTDAVKAAYGYALLPSVGKGGVVIEGGGGKGVVYLIKTGADKYYGTCQVEMGGVGLTLGGETYTELLLFKDQAAFDKFTDSGLQFAAGASATAIQAGTTVVPSYSNGVAVFISNTKGLMVDASIGGQQFTVKPDVVKTTTPPPTTGPAM